MNVSLSTMPIEIQTHIMGFLAPSDQAALGMTSCHFRNLTLQPYRREISQLQSLLERIEDLGLNKIKIECVRRNLLLKQNSIIGRKLTFVKVEIINILMQLPESNLKKIKEENKDTPFITSLLAIVAFQRSKTYSDFKFLAQCEPHVMASLELQNPDVLTDVQLLPVARQWIQEGKLKFALDLASKMKKQSKKNSIPDAIFKEIAKIFIERAEFVKVYPLIDNITNPTEKVSITSDMIVHHALNKNYSEIAKLFMFIDKMELAHPEYDKALVIQQVSSALAVAGDFVWAGVTLEFIKGHHLYARGLENIALEYARYGEYEKAGALALVIFKSAPCIDYGHHEQLLGSINVIRLVQEDKLMDALNWVDSQKIFCDKNPWYHEIVLTLAKMGKFDKADEIQKRLTNYFAKQDIERQMNIRREFYSQNS